jgi:broad specificity phosphatase PhoE
MELYLIRHGQSANNANPSSRVADPPLTPMGERQALRAGKALVNKGIDKLYCSPMLRTLQTAQIMSEPLGLPPHVFVGLHEWYAAWEDREGVTVQLPGLTRQQMTEVCPNVVLSEEVTDEGWLLQPWESMQAMRDKAGRDAHSYLEHLAQQHPEPREKVAAVTHGGFLSTFIGAAYGLAADDNAERFAHKNTAISKLRLTDGQTQLRYMNRITHLTEDMLTW